MIGGIRAELYAFVRRPASWAVAILWLLLGLVFGYLFPLLSYNDPDTGVPGSGQNPDQALAGALPAELVTTAIQGLPMFAGALAVLIGVLVTGSDYQWGTLKTLLTNGGRRVEFVLARMGFLVVAMFLMTAATFVVDAGASVVVATATGKSISWPDAGSLVVGFAGGWLIATMWSLGGMVLATLVRNTAVAAGIGLVWALAVENLIRLGAESIGLLDAVQRFLPGTNAGSLVAALGVAAQGGGPAGTPGVNTVNSGTQAAITLAAYILVFLVGSAVVLRQRDVA